MLVTGRANRDRLGIQLEIEEVVQSHVRVRRRDLEVRDQDEDEVE